MRRRIFVGGLVAGLFAPAIVRADSLMKIIVPEHKWSNSPYMEYLRKKYELNSIIRRSPQIISAMI